MSSESEDRQPEGRLPQVVPEVHLRDYIAIVLQHIKLVAVIAIACLALGVLKVWSAKPEYKATVRIRVRLAQGPEEMAGNYASYVSQEKEISSYCHLIKGSDLAKTLVAKLGIGSYEQLGLSEPEPGLLGKAKNWVVAHIPTSRPESASGASEQRRPLHFAPLAQQRTNAEVVADTNLIQISYTAEDPGRASQICLALANLFIGGEQELRLSSAQRWMSWFREQQAQFEKKVAISEEELLGFHKKVDAYVSTMEDETETGFAALQKTIELLKTRQAEVRVQRIELETRQQMLQELAGTANPDPINLALLDNPNIDRFVQTRTDLRRQLALARIRYKPRHPSVIRLEESLVLVEEDIKAEAEQALEVLEKRLGGERTKEERLAEELRIVEEQATQANVKLVEYNALKRSSDANVRFLDTIIGKATEANLATNIESVNIDLITADPDVSRAPARATRTMILAVFIGLVIGIGLAFFMDYMDTSLATPADVQRNLDVDQLAVLVHAGYKLHDRRAPVLAARDHPDSTLAENFRTLRASLLFSPRFRGVRFIVVTSSVAGEGKTTVAGNLAVVLARAGKRVLLVDADMRRPAIHRLFELDREPGLNEFLEGKKAFADVLRQSDTENLSILTCGSRASKPVEVLGAAAERIKELADSSGEFDYVVFDTPPLTLSDPTLLVKSVGGSVLLVIRSGEVSRDVVERSVDKLRDVDSHIAGAVLNNFDLRKQGYYYGYGYRYYDYYYRHYGYSSDEAKKKEAKEQT